MNDPVSLMPAVWDAMVGDGKRLKPGHCILGTRVALEVCRYFGEPHPRPVTTDVLVANSEARPLLEAGVPVDEWPPEAWTVGVDAGAIDEARLSGHLICITDTHLIDLSARQFDRPLKNLPVAPLSVPRQGDSPWIVTNDKTGVLLRYKEVDAPIPTSVKNWRKDYKDFAAELIRILKKCMGDS